jgi:flagellar protein FliO/FliZ
MMQDAVLRVTIALVLVVAAILVMAWLARRSGFASRQDNSGLKLVSRLSLGPRQNIAVVQVQDTWLVLGLTANSITPLHTLPAQATAPADNAVASDDFAQALAAKLGKALKRS